jgi:cation transport regulator ChaB
MYQTIHELPAGVRKQMPEQACELYVAAYNRIRERAIRGGDHDESAIAREAHDGAMLAVQSEFEVDADGRWQRAPISEDMDHLGRAARDKEEGSRRRE